MKGISERNRIVQIVHDPTPLHEGGFAPGARMSYLEMRATLKIGHFTVGMKFLINGRTSMVKEVNSKHGKQGLCTI